MGTTAKVQLHVTVLVAKDDASIRFVLKHLLESEGFTVEETEDGTKALEMIQQNKPDLVLLDAVMPGRDGFELCALLQNTPGYDRIPVLIVTGLEDEESINRA